MREDFFHGNQVDQEAKWSVLWANAHKFEVMVDIDALAEEGEVFVQFELCLLYQFECCLVDFKVVGINASIVGIFIEFLLVILLLSVHIMVAESLSKRAHVRGFWLCYVAPWLIPWLNVCDSPIWVSWLCYVLVVCKGELHRLRFLTLMKLGIEKKIREVFETFEPS